jgi:hypothetical protein
MCRKSWNPSDVVSGLCSEGFIVATVEISFSNRVTQDYVIPLNERKRWTYEAQIGRTLIKVIKD